MNFKSVFFCNAEKKKAKKNKTNLLPQHLLKVQKKKILCCYCFFNDTLEFGLSSGICLNSFLSFFRKEGHRNVASSETLERKYKNT